MSEYVFSGNREYRTEVTGTVGIAGDEAEYSGRERPDREDSCTPGKGVGLYLKAMRHHRRLKVTK